MAQVNIMTATAEERFEMSPELNNEPLYKVYMLCPRLEKFLTVDNPGTVTFLPGLTEHLSDVTQTEPIMFSEDEPRKYHRFSNTNNAMLVMLVPPHLVICVNGQLLLKSGSMQQLNIVGAYLFNDSDQFFANSNFCNTKVNRWIEE